MNSGKIGAGGRDRWKGETSKALQEVPADLKNVIFPSNETFAWHSSLSLYDSNNKMATKRLSHVCGRHLEFVKIRIVQKNLGQ